jgi:Ca2+-binding RTX toxin-like protein
VRAIDEAGNVGWPVQLDTAAGGAGSKRGRGLQGGRRDQLQASPCANLQRGTGGADRLQGTRAGDRMLGLGGADRLSGRRGRDCLRGGKGHDALLGGTGRDAIRAADGTRDRVDCGRGRDLAFADLEDSVRRCERVKRPT